MRSLLTITCLLVAMAGMSQQAAIDSLTSHLQENLHDTDRVNTLNNLAWKLKFVNPDTAIVLSLEASSIAEALNWQLGIAKSVGRLGSFHYLKSDFSTALEYYFRAVKINEGLGDKRGIAGQLGNIGGVYMIRGDYPRALEYFFKALKMDEELDNKRSVATHLGNIGNVYDRQHDFSNALKFYFKALQMDTELNNKNGIARHIGNIGSVYKNQTDYPKALEYYFKSLKMHEELGNKYYIAITLGDIAVTYTEQGESMSARGDSTSAFTDKYVKALEYYDKALKIGNEVGDKNTDARHLGNIGYLYFLTGQFEKADTTLQKALALSVETGDKDLLEFQHKFLSVLYESTKRPAKAFKAYKLYIIYRDSIYNEENTKAQTRTEMKYEYEKAELVKQQEEKGQARIESELTSRRDNLQYSIILIALLVLFGGVLGLGFINVSERMAEGIIFFSFLILFEFLLVLADPYIENWSGGAPGIKLLFNAGIAALIFPAHAFFESKLKGRLVKR